MPNDATKNTLEEKVILEDIKLDDKTNSSTLYIKKSPIISNDVTDSQDINKKDRRLPTDSSLI